jgi:N-acetylmuramoyl-L-alanine amidase
MKALLATLGCAWLAACSTVPPPVGTPLSSSWRASPNFDERRPNLVILHHTSDDTVGEALGTLLSPGKKVSAHYLVGRDGAILQLVDERSRAWHAGVSYWGGQTDINSASIGIELDNNGFEPFPEPLLSSLLALLGDLKARYNIPAANFVGHADVAPGRKDDPSRLFPWQRLADAGFGLWCGDPAPVAPAGFDLDTGLMALGYNPANPASQRAFRNHFTGDGEGDNPNPARTLGILHCLLQQKAAWQ